MQLMTGFYGVDLSLTSTGVAAYVDGEWDAVTIKSKTDDGTPSGFLHRVHTITSQIINWADPAEGDVIAIEAPAYGARGAALDRVFASWWMVMDGLTNHHGEPWVVTSTSLKKLATGRGNCGKDEVLLAGVKRLPDAPITGNDTADAAWLVVAASIIAGEPIVDLPAAHKTGLTRIMKGKQ